MSILLIHIDQYIYIQVYTTILLFVNIMAYLRYYTLKGTGKFQLIWFLNYWFIIGVVIFRLLLSSHKQFTSVWCTGVLLFGMENTYQHFKYTVESR